MIKLLLSLLGGPAASILKPLGIFLAGALAENRRQAGARNRKLLKLSRRKDEIRDEVKTLDRDGLYASRHW